MSVRGLSILLLLIGTTTLSAAVDFITAVKPILAKHCYDCHGPDRQKNALRLDLKAAALMGGEDHGAPIKPGNSKDSVLIRFVSGEDKANQMPPKGERLSEAEIKALRTWIDEGAVWPDDGSVMSDPMKTHWAYQPVTAPPTRQPGGDASAPSIDTFITTKLQQAGLSLAPPADPLILCRRLYFDIIGLPPTPEQLAAFKADLISHPQSAISSLITTLLASPRYGERWARHWLDVVRFAESDGFETNRYRPNAWPYRDYVIQAFNNDTPYNQFITEQLAGDVTGKDAATAFIVGGTTDIVKSPDPILTAQQRADELNDMVSATGGAFLGLTVNCARCHNHKFDPITNDDYYGMVACFAGVKHGERAIKTGDTEERKNKAESLQAELAQIDERIREFEPIASTGRTLAIAPNDEAHTQAITKSSNIRTAYEPGTARGEASFTGDASHPPTLADGYWVWPTDHPRGDVFVWKPKAVGHFRVWVSWGSGYKSHDAAASYVLDDDGDLTTTQDQREIGKADQRKFADGTGKMPNRKLWSGFKDMGEHDFTATTKLILRQGAEAAHPTADLVVLQADTHTAIPTQPHLRLPVQRASNTDRFTAVEAKFVRFTIDATTQLEPCLDELEIYTAGPASHNIALASAGAKASSSSNYPNNPFHKLEHLNDGRYGNEHSWISNERGKGWACIELARAQRIDRVVWSRDRDNVGRYNDRTATAYRIEVSLDGQTWQTVSTAQDRLPYGRKVGGPIYSTEGLPAAEAARLQQAVQQRQKTSDALAAVMTFPMVYAGKFTEPGDTHKLHRGDVSDPREIVQPAMLSKIGPRMILPPSATEQQRRLALAQWITDPANPLTARVIVNRLWHYHFGTGIVDTPSDLGVNGGRPTHPELLDWLANELVASGWSLKHIQRLILMSATYQQSSTAQPPKAIALDAANRLLWRYPPRRLEAEALRDTILAVSGTLDLKMGGPGFELFEPNDNYVKVYTSKTAFGAAEFRRMVYQAKPRVQLDDTFGTFDCPDAGQAAPKRTVSTTPLQALSLLNSTFAMQQAGYFAERVQRESGQEPLKQVQQAFRVAFGREAAAQEIAESLQLIKQHGLPVLCRALMNANEFVQVR